MFTSWEPSSVESNPKGPTMKHMYTDIYQTESTTPNAETVRYFGPLEKVRDQRWSGGPPM